VRLGNIFEFEAIKQAKSQREIPTDNSENWVNYIVQSTMNNMFSRKVNKKYLIENNEPPVSWNRIVLWVTLPAVSYQPYEFWASQVITAKADWLNEKNWLYIVSKISKLMYQFSYAKKPWIQIYKNMEIILPTQNWKIAFEYMEDYIRFLEAERIEELEAYLLATGLKDYNLTSAEKSALDKFAGGIIYNSFRIWDLFNVVWTKSLDSNAIDFIKDWINFVWRTFENNWIQWKISRRDFKPNEPFSLTATVIWNYKYVKYQREEYYCSQNINKLTPKEKVFSWNKKIAYYFVTLVQKFVSLYDWQQWWYKLNDIKNFQISIPIQNSEIDFDFMETFIRAIEKFVIKDVVLWNERKLQAYRQVIS